MIKPHDNRDVTMTMRITRKEQRKLEARAKRHKVSMSAFMRWLLQEAE